VAIAVVVLFLSTFLLSVVGALGVVLAAGLTGGVFDERGAQDELARRWAERRVRLLDDRGFGSGADVRDELIGGEGGSWERHRQQCGEEQHERDAATDR
jgi:hypothetical protein